MQKKNMFFSNHVFYAKKKQVFKKKQFLIFLKNFFFQLQEDF